MIPTVNSGWLAAHYRFNTSTSVTEIRLLSSTSGQTFSFLHEQPHPVQCDGAPMGSNTLYTGALWVDPNSALHVVLAGTDLCRSVDGGQSFTKVNTDTIHNDIQAVVGDPTSSNTIFVG